MQVENPREIASGSAERNASPENTRRNSGFRNSAARSRENDRKAFNSLENTLSLGAVNAVMLSGPVVPKSGFRRPLPGRALQNPGLRKNEPPESSTQEIPVFSESNPVDQTSVHPTNFISENSTPRAVPVEYSAQDQDDKLLHHRSQEPGYEVTEEAEQQPLRRRKPGRVRKNRNTGIHNTDSPSDRLFSTADYNNKLLGISMHPGSQFRTKVIKIKPTVVPLYIKGHEENKSKYRYDLFNKHAHRTQFNLKLKKTNRTLDPEENEKDSEDNGGDTPSLNFAESQQSSSIEIILPDSLNLSENEEIYLTDGE